MSQLFFEWSVPPPIEWLWSIPGYWFGLPVFCMVGPLWLIYVHSNLNLMEQEREQEGGGGSLTTVFVWAISLTILLGICWILFLSDGEYERIMSRGIFSHYAFALGPIAGTFLCSWVTSDSDNNLSGSSRSIGLYHILLYSSSIVPILILKHACRRYRPGVHQPNLITMSGKKHLTIIPRLQTKWGPTASFPSGACYHVSQMGSSVLGLDTHRSNVLFGPLLGRCSGGSIDTAPDSFGIPALL